VVDEHGQGVHSALPVQQLERHAPPAQQLPEPHSASPLHAHVTQALAAGSQHLPAVQSLSLEQQPDWQVPWLQHRPVPH